MPTDHEGNTSGNRRLGSTVMEEEPRLERVAWQARFGQIFPGRIPANSGRGARHHRRPGRHDLRDPGHLHLHLHHRHHCVQSWAALR
jgi:hypothetical protein